MAHLPSRRNRLELLLALGALADIWMVLLHQSQVGVSDRLLVGIATDAQDSVMVLCEEVGLHACRVAETSQGSVERMWRRDVVNEAWKYGHERFTERTQA